VASVSYPDALTCRLADFAGTLRGSSSNPTATAIGTGVPTLTATAKAVTVRLVFLDDSVQSEPIPRRGMGELVAVGAVIRADRDTQERGRRASFSLVSDRRGGC
jgi:hypothetical protein